MPTKQYFGTLYGYFLISFIWLAPPQLFYWVVSPVPPLPLPPCPKNTCNQLFTFMGNERKMTERISRMFHSPLGTLKPYWQPWTLIHIISSLYCRLCFLVLDHSRTLPSDWLIAMVLKGPGNILGSLWFLFWKCCWPATVY